MVGVVELTSVMLSFILTTMVKNCGEGVQKYSPLKSEEEQYPRSRRASKIGA